MTPPVAGGLTQSLNLVAPPGFTQHVTGVLTLPRREVPKLQKSTAENTALAEQEIANVKKGSGVRTTGKGWSASAPSDPACRAPIVRRARAKIRGCYQPVRVPSQ